MIPSVVMIICLPLCPESPKYNLIVKSRREQAESDLKKLRNESNVSFLNYTVLIKVLSYFDKFLINTYELYKRIILLLFSFSLNVI